MNGIIKTLINKYEQKGDFNYATVTDDMIAVAEKELRVNLPKQYIDFLKEYGNGGIAGIEIIGVGLTGKMLFVDTTLDYRKDGLPDNLVVIENVDDYVSCIDCDTEKIVSWDFSGFIKEDYNSFDEYLEDQMNSAIENL